LKKAIVIGASSDIGSAIARELISSNWEVVGTVRDKKVKHLQNYSNVVAKFNLESEKQINKGILKINKIISHWDALIITPGTMNPIGNFIDVSEKEWFNSILINFINQIRVVKKLLITGNVNSEIEPIVIFFAGGGTNSANPCFSAYTVSKIALIKMTEILDEELPNFRIVVIGPGWVETKIHREVLDNVNSPITLKNETKNRILKGEFVSMPNVVQAILWAINSPKKIIGGRNFSIANDPYKNKLFQEKILEDSNFLKLRRDGNKLFWNTND
jgi:NADP-dependent 3-hydroxy acid dehydrogenase YdfG